MKTFVKVFLLVVILGVLASAVFAAPNIPLKKDSDTVSVTLTPTHYRDLLILKSTKIYMGAAVEVHNSTGAVISSTRIYKKKMIIDFYDIPYGAYTISVVKDKKAFEFNYTKRQDSEF